MREHEGSKKSAASSQQPAREALGSRGGETSQHSAEDGIPQRSEIRRSHVIQQKSASQ